MISLFYCRFVSGIRGYWMIFQPSMRRAELVKLAPVLNIFCDCGLTDRSSISPWSMGMRFRPLLLLKSVFRTLGKRFLRFSSLKGVVEHSWATLFPIFATEVADEGVVRVEEELKCGGWKSRAPLRHIRPSVQGLCTSWQVFVGIHLPKGHWPRRVS